LALSSQPTRPNMEVEARIKAGARKRFITSVLLSRKTNGEANSHH
jgi:hypothetical protein